MKIISTLVGFSLSMTVLADTSVYGRIHVSINKNKDSSSRIDSDGSRIGLKGVNTLDNGLKATHQVEFDYDFTRGDKAILVRHSWVGVRGSFGEFRVGRQTTPYSAVDNAVDFLQRDNHGFHTDLQSPSVISYLNKINAFGFAASYIVKDSSDADGTANLLLNYKTYPFYAGMAYQKTPSGKGQDGVKLALGHRDTNYAVGLVVEKEPVSGDKIRTLSGKYIVGNIWLAGQYSKNSTVNLEQKTLEIGYKLGHKTKAYYEWENDKGIESNRLGLIHNF